MCVAVLSANDSAHVRVDVHRGVWLDYDTWWLTSHLSTCHTSCLHSRSVHARREFARRRRAGGDAAARGRSGLENFAVKLNARALSRLHDAGALRPASADSRATGTEAFGTYGRIRDNRHMPTSQGLGLSSLMMRAHRVQRLARQLKRVCWQAGRRHVRAHARPVHALWPYQQGLLCRELPQHERAPVCFILEPSSGCIFYCCGRTAHAKGQVELD